jgi:2-dehydro-3-deoxy-D-arabinonate dehydratase
MQLCRFNLPGQGARLGLIVEEVVYDLTASGTAETTTMAALLAASLHTRLSTLLQRLQPERLPAYALADLWRAPSPDAAHLLPPVDRQEVWAAGVTYAWSREARVREAVAKDVYVKVYEAARPELFFKSLPEKVVGWGDWVGLRGDSHWNVPEPELALVLNSAMDIIGYTIGNDVSSRDIEGENPLYLPQAKVYRHACALGPVITLADETVDGQNLTVDLAIERGGAEVFRGTTSTAQMHRQLGELAEYLGRYNDFPYGAILLTGTGIVPPDDFTLRDGDTVTISIEAIGELRNLVRQM